MRSDRTVGSPKMRCYNPMMIGVIGVIGVNPKVLGGTPVFAGTRVPVASLFDYLKRSRTIDYFLMQFPTVKREQVQRVLDDAQAKTLPQPARGIERPG